MFIGQFGADKRIFVAPVVFEGVGQFFGLCFAQIERHQMESGINTRGKARRGDDVAIVHEAHIVDDF